VVVVGDQAGQMAAFTPAVQMACSTASTTKRLVIVVATDQPRIRRA
jgi:alkaline phosphatase